MDQQEHIVKLLFGNYTGALNASRQLELNAWLALRPENQAVLRLIQDKRWVMQQLQLRSHLEQRIDLDQVLQTIINEITIVTGDALSHEGTSKPNAILRVLTQTFHLLKTHSRVAALILLALGLGVFGLYRLSLPGDKPNPKISRSYFSPAAPNALLSVAGKTYPSTLITRKGGLQEGPMKITSDGSVFFFSGHGAATSPAGYYDIQTLAANTYGIHLPDSSIIKMNAKATMKIPFSYDVKQRIIKMQGQGFFHVEPVQAGAQPFIVDVQPPDALKKWFPHDSGLTVISLATSFDIKANPDDSSIIVSLFTGRVKIIPPNDTPVVLKAGDVYRMDKDGHGVVMTLDDLSDAPAWKDNAFLFNMEPAGEILHELSRWYDAKILYVKKPSGVYRIHGRRDEPIDSLLHRMKRAPFHFEYRLKDDTIIVSH